MIGSKKRLIGSKAPIKTPSGSAITAAATNEMTIRSVEAQMSAAHDLAPPLSI